MAGALESFFQQQRKRGVQLAGAPKKELTKAIQQKGKAGQGKKITAQELAKGRQAYAKTGGQDYLATIGRTYKPTQLSKQVQSKLKKSGFTKDESGYYTKQGGVTGSILDKAISAGYDPQDVRSYLAGSFAQNELDDQIAKFLGEGGQYKLDTGTGRWAKQELIPDDKKIPAPGEVNNGKGIYSGINPDELSGNTIAEILYATAIDPAKIDAKSRERLGILQAGTSAFLGKLQAGSGQSLGRMQAASAERLGRLQAATEQNLGALQAGSAQSLGRMQTASSERLARLNAQAEKDLARSQQAAALLGQKMGYGTEYDIAKMNRLAGLQQANIQQATSLYNLIPAAF